MSKTALIIVDPQNDFCQNGSLQVNKANQIFPFINRLRKENKFDYTFITLDWHPDNHLSFAKNHENHREPTIKINGVTFELWPIHCVQGSYGAQINRLLKTQKDDILVKKGLKFDEQQYSGFGTTQNPTQLEKNLKQLNVKNVCIVGLALDFCLGNTALDAKKAGFQVSVIQQGTKAVFKQKGQQMIEKFKQNNIKYVKFQNFNWN